MSKWIKQLFCRHTWYYERGSISGVECPKCDKKDIFFPW